MTRVSGVAIDPESGEPLAGRLVYATLMTQQALPEYGQEIIDEDTTATDGTWELDLRPTTQRPDVHYRIRVWLVATFWANVPDPPPGNTPVDINTILIPTPDPPVPPQPPGPYVMRSELERPGGVATLGSDGILKLGQRPAGGGTGGEPAEWFSGVGPPVVVPGASVGDIYIDRLTGNLYQLT